MSVVATRVYADRIEIAADSQITWGMTQTSDYNVKLFATELGITVGGCGPMQDISLFKIFLRTRVPSSATEDGIIDLMHEFNQWLNDHAEVSTPDEEDAAYHLIYDRKAFAIQRYNVREITSFDAIGAGMDYALTAMELDRSPQDAVKIACKLNIFCAEPVSAVTVPTSDVW